MKSIKELGLEVIELEDQVLLVESKVGGGKLNDWVKLSIPIIEKVEEWNEDFVGFCNKIIASTKPLEGLPLLVIEDYVNIPEFELELEKLRFQQGYDKARQIFKFTEEDLRKAMDYASQITNNRLKYIDDYIQSISKKELWIEIEDKIAIDGHTIIGIEPKITNGKIKSVWK